MSLWYTLTSEYSKVISGSATLSQLQRLVTATLPTTRLKRLARPWIPGPKISSKAASSRPEKKGG